MEDGVEDDGRIVWKGTDGTTLVVYLTEDEIKMVNPSFDGRSSLQARVRRLVENPEEAENPTLVVDLVDETGERLTPLALQLEEGMDASTAVDEVARIFRSRHSPRSLRSGRTNESTSPRNAARISSSPPPP